MFKQDERQLLLDEWNDTAHDVPQRMCCCMMTRTFRCAGVHCFDLPTYDETECVHRLFEEQAALGPQHIAVQETAGTGPPAECVWTYQELNERANQLACVVHDAVDWDAVAKGDREPLVGVMCEVYYKYALQVV